MYFNRSIARCLSLMLIFTILSGMLIFISCQKDGTDPSGNSTSSSQPNVTTDDEFELTDPPKIPTADIYMIKPSDECPDWKSGSMAKDVQYYVTDMMDVLDSQEWKEDSKVPVNKVYHFSIYISRPVSELDSYNISTGKNEETTTSTSVTAATAQTSVTQVSVNDAETDENDSTETVLVQYLVNIETGVINARMSDFDSFDTYTTLEGVDLGMLKAYLKYYFGPEK